MAHKKPVPESRETEHGALSSVDLVYTLYQALSPTEQSAMRQRIAMHTHLPPAHTEPTRGTKKTHRYSETAMKQALDDCITAVQVIPTVIAYDAWYEQQRDDTRARGDTFKLPSNSVFRRRYGNWRAALDHFGYTQKIGTPAQVPADRRGSRLAMRNSARGTSLGERRRSTKRVVKSGTP